MTSPTRLTAAPPEAIGGLRRLGLMDDETCARMIRHLTGQDTPPPPAVTGPT